MTLSRLTLLGLAAGALLGGALPAQSPYPASFVGTTPDAWERSSIVGSVELARAETDRARAMAAALQKESAALLAENNRLRDELSRSGNLAKLDVNDPESLKIFRRQYNLLLSQYRATAEQLAALQVATRRQQESLHTTRTDAAREKARADATESSLRSGREASGRLAEEANGERVRAADATARATQLESEAARLREDKRVLEALVRRLDPERTAKLEEAVRERDRLLRAAADKMQASAPRS